MSRRSTTAWTADGCGVAQAMMVAIGVLTIYPLYFIVITAFKTRRST